MTARIRPAEPQDVSEILAMVRELAEYEKALHEVVATEAQLATALFSDGAALFGLVAELPDGELAGFALYFLNFSTWLGQHGIYLEDLYVRPEHRGAGFGRAFLVELARLCVERGYGRLEWWVLDWNEPALGFYRSLGAQPMHEWTVQRVTGEALIRLSERDAGL